jgi:hypothetical protein
MREPLDVRFLPSDLRLRPDIRARSMHIVKIGHAYIVTSPEQVKHTVLSSITNPRMLQCDCSAAAFGRECSHILSIQQTFNDAA